MQLVSDGMPLTRSQSAAAEHCKAEKMDNFEKMPDELLLKVHFCEKAFQYPIHADCSRQI